MKKYILLLVISSTISHFSKACDICGCGVGNNYIGILPEFHKHIAGIRYRHNSMWTHLGVGGNFTYLTTKEVYNTVEAWGGWTLGRHFRIMASVPYNFNERTNQGITKSKNGIGDISLSGFYQLLNQRHTVLQNKLLIQSLWIGGGIKVASGKYNPSDKSATSNNANLFQLGTGSYDFTLQTMYDIRLQDAGLNLSSSYKINTANKYDYRYGNKFNTNLQGYYKFRILHHLTIAPNIGVQYESARSDMDNGFTATVSGGKLFSGIGGVEITWGKIALGANVQTPFSQNLANGIVKANNRMMVHLAIAL